MSEARRILLRTGVELNLVVAGPTEAPPVILLHGFPESHRTWRELAPLIEDRFRLIMPDLRGFGGSDRPQEVSAYGTSVVVDDVLALAESLGLERFNLVGHDLGGVVAWTLAEAHPERVERLAIINGPHPFIFQKSLFQSGDQRTASRYISSLRLPSSHKLIAANLDDFFNKVIADNVESRILETERQQYLTEWSQPGALEAMTNWYRAAKVIVPPTDVPLPLPDALLGLAPNIHVPTLVIWGMRDSVLLPVQLEGLERIVDDLRIVRLPDAGHFATWESPNAVAQALRPFLAGEQGATARA
ncbi:MAG: alpha/beta fold hydrolase [Sphingomicrobium sp.]